MLKTVLHPLRSRQKTLLEIILVVYLLACVASTESSEDFETCDFSNLMLKYEYNPFMTNVLFEDENCLFQCGQMKHMCAAIYDDSICFCGNKPTGMVGDNHKCSKSNVKFLCGQAVDTSMTMELSLKQSIAGIVGGSQEILLNYLSAPNMDTEIDKLGLEMRVRPDLNWVPISKPPNSSVTFISPKPGGQDVLLRLVKDSKIEVTKTAIRVSIDRSIATDAVNFKCPKTVEINNYFNCYLSIDTADKFYGDITWEGQFSQGFTLPGKSFDYIGTPTLYPGESLPECKAGDLIVTGTQSMSEGKIFEVFVTLRKPSKMKVFLLRPNCGSNRLYDYYSDECMPTTFKGHECTADEVFCPIVRGCVPSKSGDCKESDRRGIKLDSPSTNPKTDSYLVEQVANMESTETGLQSFRLTTPFLVQIGDRLGLSSEDKDAIDCTTKTDYAPADLEGFGPIPLIPTTKISGLVRRSTTRFKISGAVAITSYPMMFLGRFTNPGTYRVSAKIRPIAQQVTSQFRIFQQFVEVVMHIKMGGLQRYVYRYGTSEVLAILEESNPCITYTWDFGDGSDKKVTNNAEVRHLFLKTGRLQVTIVAFNTLTTKIITKDIDVYEQIELGAIKINQLTVSTPVVLSVELKKGSHCSFEWFVDGTSVGTSANIPQTEHIFALSGKYNISVIVSNPISQQTVSSVRTLISPVRDIKLLYESYPVGYFYLSFTYVDGFPTSASISVDGGIDELAKIASAEKKQIHSKTYLFPNIGKHTFKLKVESAEGSTSLESTFVVDLPVTNVGVEFNPKRGAVGLAFTVTVRIAGGTSGTIWVTDGNMFNETKTVGELEPMPQRVDFLHTYSEVGIFQICANIFNADSKKITCDLYEVSAPLGDYIFDIPTNLASQGKQFTLAVKGGASKMLEVELDWGDGDPITVVQPYEVGAQLRHVFKTLGDFVVHGKVRQFAEEKALVPTSPIKVRSGITNFGCKVIPAIGVPGDTFTIKVQAQSSAAININLTEKDFVLADERITNLQLWEHEVRKDVQGKYQFHVEASTEVDLHKCDLMAIVQNRIINFFADVDTPYVGITGTNSLNIKYTGAIGEVPEDILITVDWGDESPVTNAKFETIQSKITIEHKPQKEGYHNLKVALSNSINVWQREIQVGLFYPILAATMRMYLAELTEIEGYGPEKNRFTPNDHIRFQLVSFDGTIDSTKLIIYNFETKQKVLDVTFNEAFFVKQFLEPGRYTVHANLTNILNFFQINTNFRIIGNVRSIKAELVTPSLLVNQVGEILITFLGLSDKVCICVKLGNGFNYVYPAVGMKGTDCPICPTFTEQMRSLVKMKRLRVYVQYTETGHYKFEAIAAYKNEKTYTQLMIAVQPTVCLPPVLYLEKPYIGNPNAPLKLKVNNRVTIIARNNGTVCENLRDVEFVWRAWKVNEMTVERLKKIPLDQIVSRYNLQIVILAKTFSPGLYEVELVGRLKDINVVPGISAYVEITEEILQINFNKDAVTSMIVSLDEPEFCLAPANYSIDPNIPGGNPGQGLTNWQISCTRCPYRPVLGNRASDEDSYTASVSCTLPKIPEDQFGSICIPSTSFDVSSTYTFTATASSNTQTGMGSLQVFFVTGQIPQLSMTLALPELALDGWYDDTTCISRTNDFVLNGVCVKGCNNETRFKWNLHYVTKAGAIGQFTDNQLVMASKYYDGETIVISADFLQIVERENKLRVCFTSENQTPYRNGVQKVCRQFYLMHPPLLGICSLNTTGLISRDDHVCISCSREGVEELLVIYRYYVKYGNQTLLFATSSNPEYCGKIPFKHDDEVEICVRAVDHFASFSERCFISIKLKSEESTHVLRKLQGLANNSDTEITDMLKTGNPNEIAVIIQSLSSVVAEGSQLEKEGEWAGTMDSKSARDIRAKVLHSLTEAVSTLTPTDPNSMLQIISSLEVLSGNSDDITYTSQLAIAELIQKSAHIASNILMVTSREDTVAIAHSILKSSLQLLNGSNYQLYSPVQLDIITNRKDMDYDTGIEEYPLFGSSKDELFNSLSVMTTRHNQRIAAENLQKSLSKIQKTLVEVIENLLQANGEEIRESLSMGSISLAKVKAKDAAKWMQTFYDSKSSVSFPDLETLFDSEDDELLVHGMTTTYNVFGYAYSQTNQVPLNSETVSLSLYKNGVEVDLRERTRSIVVRIKKKPEFVLPDFSNGSTQVLPEPMIAVDGSTVYQALLMFSFHIYSNDVSFHLQLKPEDLSVKPQYLVFARHIYPPDLSRKDDKGELIWAVVPPDTAFYDGENLKVEEVERNLTFFMNNVQFRTAKEQSMKIAKNERLTFTQLNTVWVGFRQLSNQEINKYGPGKSAPPIPYPYMDQINTTTQFRGYELSCSFLSEDMESWESYGCEVARESTAMTTVCHCNHLTTFAAGWAVAPNALDFDYIFKNIQFERNATLYATEIIIFVFFFLLFIWARRKDNKDIEKLGITPFAENNPADEYLYEVIIGTGIRRLAGTKSTVCVQLNGDRAGNRTFTLRDSKRSVLQRGSVDRFLMAVPKPLGELRFLRLWHNNSGKGDDGSWFCDFAAVIDLQTKVKYLYLVERWFAVDEDDCLVDRVIPVASSEDRLRFTYIFASKVKQDISDEHLWVSVFTRPAYSRFTRVERVACCLLLLCLTMVSSCMFYRHEGPIVQDVMFSIGPFALTPYVAFTGAMSSLITFIPLTLIIFIFRKSKLRVSHAVLLKDVVEDHLDEDLHNDSYPVSEIPVKSSDLIGPPPEYSSAIGLETFTEDFEEPPPYSVEADSNILVPKSKKEKYKRKRKQKKKEEEKKKKKSRLAFSLPWQMRILGWFLLVAGIAASVAFTTFYGVSFGDAACKQWLSSLCVSFFMDIFLTQPIKVIMFAIFFAVVCKNKTDGDEFDFSEEDNNLMNTLGRRYRLNHGEEYMHDDYLRGMGMSSGVVKPPDPEMLERARNHRMKQRKMHDILRELLFFFIFFTLLVLVSNGFRDPNAMNLRQSLKQLFFDEKFSEINSIENVWRWLKESLAPGLRVPKWYNGEPPVGLRGFLADRANRIMGHATLRQVRTKPDSCTIHKEVSSLFKHCYSPYNIITQDEKTYLPGWIESNSSWNHNIQEWTYTKATSRNGFPFSGRISWYSGGGYQHKLRGSEQTLIENLEKLEAENWLDHRTRAVIIEFTIYNPSVNLFGMVVVLFELPGTGGILPSFRIEPSNLLAFANSEVLVFEFACQILFVLALICLLIKEVRNLWQERCAYFHSLRAWAQLFIIAGSFGSIAIFAYVTLETKALTLEFYRSNGNGYANFQMVAHWNEILCYMVALITFVAILMLMHIFRFNQHIGLLSSVLQYAAKDMKYFLVVFGLVFFSFVVTFFLLFFDTMNAYSTMIASMETSFQIVLGKFDLKSLYEREPILGPIVFATFSLFIVFIMLSMFVAILTDSFETVRRDPSLQCEDHEMMGFMLVSFILWSGLSSFSFGKKVLDAYSTTATDQIYDDNEEHEFETIISNFIESVDLFIGSVKKTELVGIKEA